MRRRRRLPRILLNAATLLSLAACGLLVTTYFAEPIYRGVPGYTLLIDGGLKFGNDRYIKAPGSEQWKTARGYAWAGVTVLHWTIGPEQFWNVTFDKWLLVPLTAVLPLGRSIGAIRRIGVASRRSRAGLCPACNYDLRATPDRCPECGTSPAR